MTRRTHGSRVARAATIGACIGLGLIQADAAFASVFRVNPVKVVLGGAQSSALVALLNEGTEPVRIQVTAFAWRQTPAGEMELLPTEDLFFFPSLLTLAPGEERNVRVGAASGLGDAERAYRIFFDELPDPVGAARGEAMQLRMRMRMGVPVFQQPTRLRHAGFVAGLAAAAGTLRLEVHNAGNTHFIVRNVRVRGLDGWGHAVFETHTPGWYVLAGGVREFTLDLPEEGCSKAREVAIEVDAEGGAFGGSLELSADACAP